MHDQTIRRVRAGAARAVAVLSALFWAVPFFGIIDLTTVAVERGPEWHDGYLLETGWGLLFTVLVALPFACLAARPGDPGASAVLGVVVLALLVGAAWASAVPQALTALGLAADLAVVAALGGVRRPPRRPRQPLLLGLAVLTAVGAAAYGRDVLDAPAVHDSVTNGVEHHGVQAALALAVAGCLALAGLTGDRLAARCAALGAGWLGVVSLVYPDLDGSLGTAGGVAALAVAAAAAATTVAGRGARVSPRAAAR